MSTNENGNVSSEATSISSEDIVSRQDTQAHEGGLADTETDIDPRTSKTGVTSEGGSDINADETEVQQGSEEAVPGVRRDEGEALYE